MKVLEEETIHWFSISPIEWGLRWGDTLKKIWYFPEKQSLIIQHLARSLALFKKTETYRTNSIGLKISILI